MPRLADPVQSGATALRKQLVNSGTAALVAPLVLLVAYFSATVILYFAGPIYYPTPNAGQLVLFLLAAYGAFLVGYVLRVPRASRELVARGADNLSRFDFGRFYRRMLWITSGIALALFLFEALRVFESYPGTLADLLLRPGSGYHHAREVQKIADAGGGSAFYLMTQPLATASVLLTPAKRVYFILGLVFFRQMQRGLRSFYVLVVLVNLVYAVMMGRQILLGELLFQAIGQVIYSLAVANRPITSARRNAPAAILRRWRRRVRRGYLTLIALVTGMAIAMSIFLAVRTKGLSTARILKSMDLDDAVVNPDWLGLNQISEGLATGVSMVSFYVTHGYTGLAQSLQLPFVWTYGLGSSRAIGRYAHQYLGLPDVSALTYPMRNEATGQSALRVWNTAFPWWASDITFAGTVVLMFGAGLLLFAVWRQIVVQRNAFGFVVLGQLFLGLFMIVANNQLFHTLQNLITTVTILGAFVLISRRRHPRDPEPRPLRVTFISGALNWGGASKSLKTLANTLASQSHQVAVIVTGSVVDASGLDDRVTVYAAGRPTRVLGRWWYLWRTIPKVPTDVYFPFVTSMIINSFPFIWNRMKCGFDRGNLLRLPKSHQIAARFIYPSYEHVCFQSEAAWRQLPYRDRLEPFILPNPFQPSGEDPGVQDGHRQRTLVTVSRLSSEKNLDLVIRAFAQSHSAGDHRLVIHGTGPAEDELRQLAADLGVAGRVDFRGASKNVMGEIKDDGIFVLASEQEGMPNALMEAMALGMPAISTNCMPGDSNLLIEDQVNGLIVPKNDVAALVEAMDHLIEHPDQAAAMGRRASEVRSRFTLAGFRTQAGAIVESIEEELRFVGP